MKAVFAALAALPLCLAAATAAAQTQQQIRLRGTIDAVAGDRLTYAVRDGDSMTVLLTPDTRVTAVSGTTISDIKPGSYIGTAAVPADGGMLRALEIHIFSDAQRGVGEGHRPFDLAPDSTMTNATVAADVAPTAQVAAGTADEDARRILTLTYKGGQQKVIVPDDAPIVKLRPGTRDLIVPGAKANISGYKAPDGSLTATSISVGTNGLTPPM
jgi:hypothetical protein